MSTSEVPAIDPQQLGQTIAHVRGAVRSLETAEHMSQGQIHYERHVANAATQLRQLLHSLESFRKGHT
jgi:hypothetical protein